MSNESNDTKKTGSLWRRYVYFGVPMLGATVAFIGGIVFWGGFNTAMEATNTLDFCISCHEMESTVYEEYTGTIHDVNRSGVGAVCSDCHVPKDWTHKIIRKIQATKELYGKAVGSINTPEKFDSKRLELAMHEWERMKNSDSRECRNCHDFDSMLPEMQRPRARQQHLNAIQTGQTCIDCHKGIAHKDVRDRADEAYLEELEAPDPKFAREIPQAYLDSLAKVEALEAAAAEKVAAEAKAAEEAVAARIASAVEKARSEEQAKASAAGGDAVTEVADAGTTPAAASSGQEVASDIDWSAVAPVNVTMFYPGQASFEWVQNGKEHGGARPFTKGGDNCTTCHGKELADMGQRIVTGEKLEPTPIPGKRGSVDATVQATHDAENLYIRLQFQAAPHTPAPFVDGGMMDPENPVKVAMMIAGTGIEYVDQAGCWATCHNDNRYMPDAPDAAAIAGAGDIATRIGATDYVTKYIAESRTEIELRGRNDKPLGGWDKLKEEAEITALLDGGTFMDLLRANPSGGENGHILAAREPETDGAIESSVTLDGDVWTAVIKRPLDTGAPGDIKIEAGKTYTVGFAIHDDHTLGRFHHVSLDWHLALDDPAASINVIAR